MKYSLIESIQSYLRESLRMREHIDESATLKLSGKTYPRMHRITLPPPTSLPASLTETLNKRSSRRDSSLSNPVTLEELGQLLGHALGSKTPSGKRRYPSGGGLFPLEIYILVNNVPSLKRSVYHYDPDAHTLEELWSLPPDMKISDVLYGYEWTAFSSCILVCTCVWDRSRKKYADFAYLLSLVESGAAAQNTCLLATALDLSACIVGGMDERVMAQLLGLRDDEQPLYSIAIGKSLPGHD